jgi:hypothetical protein
MRYLAVFALSATMAFGQAATQPVATKAEPSKPLTTEQKLALANIQIAIDTYQMASQEIEKQANQVLDPLKSDVNTKIDEARKLLGLDMTYEYNVRTHTFGKKVVAKEVPASSPGVKKP